jgi:hypothetical protein
LFFPTVRTSSLGLRFSSRGTPKCDEAKLFGLTWTGNGNENNKICFGHFEKKKKVETPALENQSGVATLEMKKTIS